MAGIGRGLDGVDLMAGWLAGGSVSRQDGSGFVALSMFYLTCVFVKTRVDSLLSGGCGRGFVHAVTIITVISRSISLLGCLGFEGFDMGAAQ